MLGLGNVDIVCRQFAENRMLIAVVLQVDAGVETPFGNVRIGADVVLVADSAEGFRGTEKQIVFLGIVLQRAERPFTAEALVDRIAPAQRGRDQRVRNDGLAFVGRQQVAGAEMITAIRLLYLQ